MDMSQLAQKMLDWGKAQEELHILELEIQEAVLEIGKTQTVGNVRATYSAGRETKDYEAVHDQIPFDVIEKYSKVEVAWAKACDEVGIVAPVKSKSAPSVTVKLI